MALKIVDDYLPKRCYGDALTAPGFVVIHHTGGFNYQGAKAAYLAGWGKAARSAHVTIEREGTVYRNVPLSHVAYHAGESRWGNLFGMNFFAFGVEIVNPGDFSPYPEAQYEAVREYLAQVMRQFKIPVDNLLTHAMVSPGRKVDPVGFPLSRLIVDLYRELEAPLPRVFLDGVEMTGERKQAGRTVVNATDGLKIQIRSDATAAPVAVPFKTKPKGAR